MPGRKIRSFFVAGTDTGVGKTLITAFLCRYLYKNSYKVIPQKWIQSGARGFSSSDVYQHIKMMGIKKDEIKKYIPDMLPYILKTACSPHLASRIETKAISEAKIIKSYKVLAQDFDSVIVEGVGGVLVPFNKKRLMVDIVEKLKIPVLLVAQNKLGAINHTLLTIEALRARGIEILGIVFNNVKGQKDFILKDNPEIIRKISKVEVFGVLPFESNRDKLYNKFLPIAEKVENTLVSTG